MASPAKEPAEDILSTVAEETADHAQNEESPSDSKSFRTISKTPEPPADLTDSIGSVQSSPTVPPPYDWDEFERRFEEALRTANENEREILKEAESLSRYFRTWASAASVHDDERAAKRLQTRRRFVNLSEEKMTQKQQHYEEVVRAFESALALLRST